MTGGLKSDMIARVAHQKDRERKTQDRIDNTEINRRRPQPVLRRKIASEIGGYAHREIAGELVQAHGQAARLRPDQIDLHDYGHRPGKALVDAEEGVGSDHPIPAWRPDYHERDGQANEPTEYENALATPGVRQLAGDQ